MKNCSVCNSVILRPPRTAHSVWEKRQFCSIKCRGTGNKPNYHYRKGNIPWNKGIAWSEEVKQKLRKPKVLKQSRHPSKSHTAWNKGKKNEKIRGNKHWNWKGGAKGVSSKIRKSAEYQDWRMIVMIRDNYTCQFCGKRGGKLHVDHIKAFAAYPELRFNLNNGRVLCIPCHVKTDTYSRKTV